MIALFAVLAPANLAAAEAKANGHWEGNIQLPDRQLGFSVDLDQNQKGAWIGTITITGSPIADVPLDSVAVEGTTVRFTANLPDSASFEAHLSPDGAKLSGTASNAKGQAEFELARKADANVKMPEPSSALSKEFEGTWEGTVDAGGQTRHVQLKLSAASDGAATAVIVSVDQGNVEIPVTTVTIHGKELQLDMRAIAGSYHGTLAASGQIAGEWSQGGQQLALNFKRPQ